MEFTGIVKGYLDNRGCEVTTELNSEYECVIALGGDGTIIETARMLEGREIPIVGINLGHLGFMSSVEKSEIYRALDALIADDYIVESRMMVEAGIERSEDNPEADENHSFTALNDIVINRMGFSRMITTHVYVNDLLVNSYFGDGVIVSTPTGSTGYNLSAGGPIVTPEAELLVITPICPHSLNMRSVVVGAHDKITVRVDVSRELDPDNAILTVDGQQALALGHGDTVYLRRAERKVKLIRFKDKSFFKLLYMKLGEQDRNQSNQPLIRSEGVRYEERKTEQNN